MVKIGVIGGGKWGQNHLRVFNSLGCELVGLADVNDEKKELADKYGIKFFTDYKKLLPLVDAVSVVVPTNFHYDAVKDCLLAGKHVLVEKPITLGSKKAKELMELAKTQKKILTVGYLFRHNSAVLELKERIKEIGDLQYITARYIHSNKPPRKDAGVVFNFGVHLIDILNFVLEKTPEKVFCKTMKYLSDEKEDCAFIVLDYGDFIAEFEVSWLHPQKKRDMWVVGSKEKLYIDLFEQILVKYPIEVRYDGNLTGKTENIEIRKNEPLKDELEHFCNMIGAAKNDKDAERINELEDSECKTTKICELCLESAKLGKELEVVLDGK